MADATTDMTVLVREPEAAPRPDTAVADVVGVTGAADVREAGPAEDAGSAAAGGRPEAAAAAVVAAVAARAAGAGPAVARPADGGDAQRPASAVAAAVPAPRARGLWLHATLASVAVVAAGIALTAPSLRPALVEHAPTAFGPSAQRLADLLTPQSQTDRDVAAMMPRLAALEAEVLRLRLDLRQIDRRLAESSAAARDSLQIAATAARAAEDIALRMREVEAAGLALAARVRAASLLAAATRLRRDVDAGAPLADGVAVLDLSGPFPEGVATALATLRQFPDGVATMRDLAIEFETLDHAIAASLGQDGSSWWRLRVLFGAADDPRVPFLQRLRVMAGDGRMVEAAALLSHSPWQTQAEPWINRVKDRTDAARAAQTVAAYAVAEARAAQTRSEGH